MTRAILLVFMCLSIVVTTAFADVKIRSKQTAAGQTTENTTYIKGKRRRTEMMGGVMVTIDQCDLGRDLQLNPNMKTYLINAYADAASEQPTVQRSTSTEISPGGTLYITTTIRDTGERRQIFGFTARHIIQTIVTESSPDACNRTKTKMEMDSWVIDAEFGGGCTQTDQYRSYSNGKSGGCRDKIVSKTTGTGKSGYPVLQTMTMFDQNGNESMAMTQEVVEISTAALDQSLFDAPADYREVKDTSQLYSTKISGSPVPGSNADLLRTSDQPSSTPESSAIRPGTSTSHAAEPTSIPEKKPGTVRVGLSGVKVTEVGEGITAADLAAAIQNSLGQHMRSTKIEIVSIDAKLASAQLDEARQKDCDYVLSITASHKKGGGGFGFGKMLGQVVGQTGLGATGSTAGNIAAGIAAKTIVSAANLSGNIRSKDELTLDFKLQPTGENGTAISRQLRTKARSDGEDIISEAVEQMAQAIINTAAK